VVPLEFRATIRKWYVVDALSPVTAADSLTAVLPEPALFAGVLLPYRVEVPYSNHQVVASPLGMTEPFSLAEVGATAEAPPVDAPGAWLVTNDESAP
jgi:hypothetical protein